MAPGSAGLPSVNENIYAVRLLAFLDAYIDRVVTRKRSEMLTLLDEAIAGDSDGVRTVIDIGSTRDNDMRSSNFFARELARRYEVTLFSDQAINPATDLDFAVAQVIQGDAAQIDEALGRFDLVISSATIEHVGARKTQAAMISSCIGLANRLVVITTPNRWHPIEFHTRLPLIHWLSKVWHRWLLRKLGFEFLADEEHLNLLDRRALASMMEQVSKPERIRDWRIELIRLFGFVSNLVLIIRVRD